MFEGPRVRKRVVTARRVIPTWAIWIALVIVLALLLLWAGYTVWLEYSGFKQKTAWEWLDLVGITSAIALVGWIFTRKQRERDVTLALEQAQNEALRAYLDQMSDLMIDQQLGRTRKDKDSLEGHVRKVAQARTIAILMGLDGRHKRRPLKLIYELELINKGDNILDLKNAGLDHADFSEFSLPRAHLSGADLRVSDLSGADLCESELTEADLRGADLRRADLRNTVLTKANLLPYDERDPERLSPHRLARTNLSNEPLSPRKLTWRDSRIIIAKGREHWWPTVTELTVTNLSHAVLVRAELEGALLGGANLFHADLRGAILTKANLLHATLLQANLKEADLSDADLSGVNLSGADLTNAKVTKEQLEETKSLKGATMPNGQKYEDWIGTLGGQNWFRRYTKNLAADKKK
jgi:uncharacterized protein YjbI with pentapeptide repeats